MWEREKERERERLCCCTFVHVPFGKKSTRTHTHEYGGWGVGRGEKHNVRLAIVIGVETPQAKGNEMLRMGVRVVCDYMHYLGSTRVPATSSEERLG